MIGPIADQVAGEIRAASIAGRASVRSDLPIAIAGALGRFGIRTIGRCGSRLLVGLDNPSGISAVELDQLGSRGWVAVPGGVQIIIGPEAEEVVRELRSKVA